MEEDNLTLFNEKIQFKEDSQKAFQNSKDLEVVFQITFDDSKQIILGKKQKIPNLFDGNRQIQTYYCANIAITDSGVSGK